MAYPIYQPMSVRDLPAPKDMVVDWGAAAGKIFSGFFEGIELGMKMKRNREASAINALNLKAGEQALQATKENQIIAKARFEQDSAINALERNIREMDLQRLEDERALGIYEAGLKSKQSQMKIEANSLDLQNDALSIMANNMQGLNEISGVLSKAQGESAKAAYNPWKQYDILEDVIDKINAWADENNINIDYVANNLPPGSLKETMNKLTTKSMISLLDTITVPVMIPNSKKSQYNEAMNAAAQALSESGAAASGAAAAADYGQAMNNIVTGETTMNMPIRQLESYLASGYGGDLIEYWDKRFKDDPSYQKRAARYREKIVEPPAAAPAPQDGPPRTAEGVVYETKMIGGSEVKVKVEPSWSGTLAKKRQLLSDPSNPRSLRGSTQEALRGKPFVEEDYAFIKKQAAEAEYQMRLNADKPKEYLEWKKVANDLRIEQSKRAKAAGIIEEASPAPAAQPSSTPLAPITVEELKKRAKAANRPEPTKAIIDDLKKQGRLID